MKNVDQCVFQKNLKSDFLLFRPQLKMQDGKSTSCEIIDFSRAEGFIILYPFLQEAFVEFYKKSVPMLFRINECYDMLCGSKKFASFQVLEIKEYVNR